MIDPLWRKSNFLSIHWVTVDGHLGLWDLIGSVLLNLSEWLFLTADDGAAC